MLTLYCAVGDLGTPLVSTLFANSYLQQKLSSQKVGIYIKGKASSVVSKGSKLTQCANTPALPPGLPASFSGPSAHKGTSAERLSPRSFPNAVLVAM